MHSYAYINIHTHIHACHGKVLSQTVLLQLSSQWVAAPQYWNGKTYNEKRDVQQQPHAV